MAGKPGDLQDQAPIDADFRPVEPEPDDRRSRHPGPGWLSLALVSLLAATIGGGVGYGASELRPGLIDRSGGNAATSALVRMDDLRDQQSRLTRDMSDAQARMDGLADEVRAASDTIDARITELTQTITPRLDRITARLETLERAGTSQDATPAEVARSVAALHDRLDDQARRLKSLDAEAPVPELATRLDAVSRRLGAVEAELSRLDESATEFTARSARLAERIGQVEARADEAAAIRAPAALALSAIEMAARRGTGFAPAFDDLSAALPDNPNVAALGDLALDGAPTRARLRQDFDDMARAVRAVENAQGSGPGGLGDFLSERIQRTPHERAMRPLEAARAALEEGDLAASANHLSELDPRAREVARNWMVAARRRHKLERALDAVRLDLMRQEQ